MLHFQQELDTDNVVVLILQSDPQGAMRGGLRHWDLKTFCFSINSLLPREFSQNKYSISILCE